MPSATGLAVALSWRPGRSVRRAPGGAAPDSTWSQAAWERVRRSTARWAWAGGLCGAVLALVAFLPAAWVAETVATRTGGRLLLSDARGTLWDGSAVPVLTGGAESRSAAMLPGRAHWRLVPRGLGFELRLHQPCCLMDDVALQLRPGIGRMSLQLQPGTILVGEWPAAWLTGLGAPWNTLQLAGTLSLSSDRLGVDLAAGRWNLVGQADLDLNDLSSPLTTLDRLGSYRLHLDAAEGRAPAFTLSTLAGELLLSGSGQWTGSQWRFRGEARAAPGAEGELDNLLNFLGRRQGALSAISIG
jgi:general secretion pathway protein N